MLFRIRERSIELPASLVVPRAISDVSVWKNNEYLTVKLHAPIEALRVHTNGREFKGRLAASSEGKWVAIGNDVHTAAQFSKCHSLPVTDRRIGPHFTHTNLVTVPAGCIMNIGVASAIELFGGNGGGFQAEYVSGVKFQFTPLTGKHWHDRFGHS